MEAADASISESKSPIDVDKALPAVPSSDEEESTSDTSKATTPALKELDLLLENDKEKASSHAAAARAEQSCNMVA